ncbi:MAG: nonribosomal peptide synthetase MxaA [Methylovulum sp.]|uniref:nonribosomal peptide synthetase MxaA n=1 Tax=Methylovulum sp. TaxID=1916980 RepID=UPI00260E21FA|nr:nonribosomal peptide synthetase MxaA [Methylovulum sp.]MDD2724142.1 nonribosomal peptide synthetase MxaA [Methylovulum sp.]MDD5123174.1 nonribosomal peptide synthetase MxaA [Methylovulum sp.]
MSKWLIFGLSLILLACSNAPDTPISDFEFLTPRPFGYLNGDEIRHKIILETRNGVQLQRGGLPKRGVVNRWLNLNTIAVNETKISGGFRYEIDLVYQAFYAPLEVKMLTIPSFDLPLAQGGNNASQTVPAWHFTLSPLRELSIRKDESGQYMRPDAAPPLLDNAGVVYGLWAAIAVTLGSAGGLAYLYGYLPGLPKRRVFKRAAKKLAGLSDAQTEEALTVFHQALNAVNGAPLFQHQLADFYQRHPAYQPVDAQLRWFFQASNQFFFSDTAPNQPETLASLRKLCAACLDKERGWR